MLCLCLKDADLGVRRHPTSGWTALSRTWPSSTGGRNRVNAMRYLTAVRFRHGLACPRCAMMITAPGGPRWWCGSCRRWFTVTTGTLLERTKVPPDVARGCLALRADQDRGLGAQHPAHHRRQLRHGVAAAPEDEGRHGSRRSRQARAATSSSTRPTSVAWTPGRPAGHVGRSPRWRWPVRWSHRPPWGESGSLGCLTHRPWP